MSFKVIWISGMPRSGTSWLSQLIASSEIVNFKMAPLFSYAFKNSVNEFSSKEEWINFFKEVSVSKDPFVNQFQRMEKGEFPKFKKEEFRFLCLKDVRHHEVIPALLKHFEDIKILHIVRNPCATIHSWMNTQKEFKVDENTMEDEWLTGKTRKTNKSEYWGFKDWLKLTKRYKELRNKYKDNVLVVSYEDLVDHTEVEVKRIYDFCGLDYGIQTSEFLRVSTEKHDDSEYSVFKNSIDIKNAWKNELDPKIAQQIMTLTMKEDLEEFLK